MNEHRFEVRWATPDPIGEDLLHELIDDAEHDQGWIVSRHPDGVVVAGWAPDTVHGLPGFVTAVELFLDKHSVGGELAAARVMTEAAFEAEALQPDTQELMAATDVAELLGVSRQRVHQLSERSDFPAPYVRLGSGPIWTLPAVEAFDRIWTRKPGRPRVAS